MEEELEILQSIYFDEIVNVDLKCEKPFFEIQLYPHDTDSEGKKRALRLDLIVSFPKSYPEEIPCFKFKNVRGITDEDVNKIQNDIISIADRNIGSQMLFEIIQFIKDELSNLGNIPKSTKCSICLEEFTDIDDMQLTHLECYHYYHKVCLIKHVRYMKIEIDAERNEAIKLKIKWKERHICCPVCREPIKQDSLDELDQFYDKQATLEQLKIINNVIDEISNEFDAKITISKKIREQQNKMKILFEKQKSQGGIIDLSVKEEIISISNSSTQSGQNNQDQESNMINLNDVS